MGWLRLRTSSTLPRHGVRMGRRRSRHRPFRGQRGRHRPARRDGSVSVLSFQSPPLCSASRLGDTLAGRVRMKRLGRFAWLLFLAPGCGGGRGRPPSPVREPPRRVRAVRRRDRRVRDPPQRPQHRLRHLLRLRPGWLDRPVPQPLGQSLRSRQEYADGLAQQRRRLLR